MSNNQVTELLVDFPDHEDYCAKQDNETAQCECFLGPAITAIRAVAELQMPDIDDMHADDYDLLSDGWARCHAAALSAIAEALRSGGAA